MPAILVASKMKSGLPKPVHSAAPILHVPPARAGPQPCYLKLGNKVEVSKTAYPSQIPLKSQGLQEPAADALPLRKSGSVENGFDTQVSGTGRWALLGEYFSFGERAQLGGEKGFHVSGAGSTSPWAGRLVMPEEGGPAVGVARAAHRALGDPGAGSATASCAVGAGARPKWSQKGVCSPADVRPSVWRAWPR